MAGRAKPHEQDPILASVLARARAAAPAGLVVFDLDSTLLDNRPRQARILQDYGRVAGLPTLLSARAEHWQTWDLRAALLRAGLSEAEADQHAAPARRFWASWFFTSAYCRLDVPVPGAGAYTRAVADAGARVAYVTGRPARMEAGTLEVFRRFGFPFPDGARVHLLMKLDAALGDDAWKERAIAEVDRLGPVVAAFDNEPAHVNAYARAWPRATCVHVDTDHSPRPIDVDGAIPSVRDFRLDGALAADAHGADAHGG